MSNPATSILSAIASALGAIIFIVSMLLENPYYRWIIVCGVTLVIALKIIF